MKKLLGLITIVLLAVPAFAQDDFGGGFDVISGNDLNALLGGGGNNNRGGRGGNNNNIPIPEDMFLQLKDMLKARKVPLSKDQEKALKPFLETEIKGMQEYLEAQFGNRGNNNNNRGNNNQANILSELFPLIAKHNTELLTAMKADLTPDQAPLIEKAEKDKKACLVMLDLFNPQQQQFNNNRGGNERENRGGNNNFLTNVPDRPFCTANNSTTAERLAPLAQILSKGKKPLTPDQEKKFSGLIETRLSSMEEELRATNSQIPNNLFNQNRNNNTNPQQLRNNIVNTVMTQLGIQTNNNNNNNRGGRGGGNPPNAANANNATANPANANATAATANNAGNARGNRGNNFNPQSEIQKKNEELYDKVAAMLDAEQGKVIKKYKYDQIKAKGGAERYRAILEEEGTPLTPEQLAQIQSLFNSQNQAIRAAAELLVQKELDAAGPQALQPPPVQNQQNNNPQQNRGNANNVNQNPLAQQIVAKVMPQVSVQRARLEKVTQDTIMKTLTPPQVASYKINSM